MTVAGIDVTAPAPRVNFELMNNYIGKRVKLVGKVESVQGTTMKVKAADEGVVDVMLKSAAPQDAYVEIDGTVESPNTLREESIIGFGNNFGERAITGRRSPAHRCFASPCFSRGMHCCVST